MCLFLHSRASSVSLANFDYELTIHIHALGTFWSLVILIHAPSTFWSSVLELVINSPYNSILFNVSFFQFLSSILL